MSLSTSLKPLFESGDRSRGRSYHERGAVYSMKVQQGLLLAQVDGSDCFYEVTLDVEDSENEAEITCTCPRFEDGYFCKHIWATILKYESTISRQGSASSKIDSNAKNKTAKRSKRQAIPQWQSLLRQVAIRDSEFDQDFTSPFLTATAQQSEIHYVIDASDGSAYEPPSIQLKVFQRALKVNGDWGKLKPLSLSHERIDNLADPVDQKISALMLGADREYADDYGYRMDLLGFSEFEIGSNWSNELCELLVGTGRLHWTLGMELPVEEFSPVEFIDFAAPARICIEFTDQADPKHSALMEVFIERNGQRIDDSEIVYTADNGVLLLTKGLVNISNREAIGFWMQAFDGPPITIEKQDRTEFLKQLAAVNGLPQVQLPKTWDVKRFETALQPTAILKLHDVDFRAKEFGAEIIFAYGETEFPFAAANHAIYDEKQNCWSVRKMASESKLLQQIAALPIADTSHDPYTEHDFLINKKDLVRMVDELGSADWKIVLLGKPIRQAGEFNVSVESGQDWFDLSAKVSFDGETIPLPGLLQAISKKEHFVMLADGSRGRIPAKMIEKFARLATFGQVEDDKIRFRPSQAMLLDAMLDAREVSFDKGFKTVRKKLRSFTGIKPKSPPRGFRGELRKYQAQGLGWLHFLREFRLGGCLADDMGLGKTIQVLSLLESRRLRKVATSGTDSNNADEATTQEKTENPATTVKQKTKSLPEIIDAANLKRKPSIVIVPKSLIFNWIEEAAKFTPRLRIVNYTGTSRKINIEQSLAAGGFDVLITTYGTMRKDIADLSQIEFDYAILDESQAIKNSKAQCAKSSRLLRAEHRLAMTGTPIENHLGELWSLFEFLNPGMLGGSTNFAKLTNQKKNNQEEREATLEALAKAIQPFMLRRTKEQVLTDLPPKTEQTLYCDMLPSQKKAYNELKEYYRVKLAKKVETDGIGRSKIQVLEALLRLRQVACDPRLVDKNAKPGAKLELLGQQITEIASEGHKVLVFSQFTSFLALVKEQFDANGICYEYLDGKSSNRAASVKRFQEDDSVSAFLISIKAGGHGLNLTAADYVFILDPWWNPAVEAQAIDRAHRMGQQNPVIAYRMICRDTVEEKIVSLQQSKRDLADKIVRSDESLIRSMTADDLQILFQ